MADFYADGVARVMRDETFAVQTLETHDYLDFKFQVERAYLEALAPLNRRRDEAATSLAQATKGAAEVQKRDASPKARPRPNTPEVQKRDASPKARPRRKTPRSGAENTDATLEASSSGGQSSGPADQADQASSSRPDLTSPFDAAMPAPGLELSRQASSSQQASGFPMPSFPDPEPVFQWTGLHEALNSGDTAAAMAALQRPDARQMAETRAPSAHALAMSLPLHIAAHRGMVFYFGSCHRSPWLQCSTVSYSREFTTVPRWAPVALWETAPR